MIWGCGGFLLSLQLDKELSCVPQDSRNLTVWESVRISRSARDACFREGAKRSWPRGVVFTNSREMNPLSIPQMTKMGYREIVKVKG